jgi:hypothetical protein
MLQPPGSEALQEQPTCLLAYGLMPNHGHFVVWPQRVGELTASRIPLPGNGIPMILLRAAAMSSRAPAVGRNFRGRPPAVPKPLTPTGRQVQAGKRREPQPDENRVEPVVFGVQCPQRHVQDEQPVGRVDQPGTVRARRPRGRPAPDGEALQQSVPNH